MSGRSSGLNLVNEAMMKEVDQLSRSKPVAALETLSANKMAAIPSVSNEGEDLLSPPSVTEAPPTDDDVQEVIKTQIYFRSDLPDGLVVSETVTDGSIRDDEGAGINRNSSKPVPKPRRFLRQNEPKEDESGASKESNDDPSEDNSTLLGLGDTNNQRTATDMGRQHTYGRPKGGVYTGKGGKERRRSQTETRDNGQDTKGGKSSRTKQQTSSGSPPEQIPNDRRGSVTRTRKDHLSEGTHTKGVSQEKENKLNDNQNGERRRAPKKKKPKDEFEGFLRNNVGKQTPVILYVRIGQLLDQKYDVKGFLCARMQNEQDDQSKRFMVVKSERVGSNTVISVEAPSKSVANKIGNLLKLSNRGSETKLVCTLDRNEALDLPTKRDEREFEKHLTIIKRRENQALSNHMDKISVTSKNIERLSSNKHVTIDEYEAKRYEKDALKDKLEELKLQKEQFTTFMKSFVSKLVSLWKNNTYAKHIEDLRRDFGVELCRLTSALPMYARRNDIIRTVQDNQVCVILGETGSGKSTQMTQYLHQAGFSEDGFIVCTQPRKIAAISLATHVASELVTNVGNVVGYKVGMRSKCGGATKILYMTDHCLLNECLKDPTLSAYSCVIVDEAHERSIYTDLLLGMLKMCLKQRPNLRAIITSATIDPEVFVRYFDACPVLRVSGRMFPVEVEYQTENDGGKSFDNYQREAVNKAVQVHTKDPPGDILVFVTSPLETEKCSEDFNNRLQGRTDFKCLVLHGQIQPDEQQLVFQDTPSGVRKIVFATNSAETSITIPGIKYVIDTGLAKEKRYDPRRNMSTLSVVLISRSSADQRKGRAGRTGPGKCYRLYSEETYHEMEAVSLPELLKVHLGQAMLKLTELGINPLEYEFVQSPGPSAIATAMTTLEELGAVKDNKITEEGKELARLPVEPRLGLIIQKGRSEDVLFDAVVLAAVSNVGSSIFFRGGSDDNKKKADKLKIQFCHNGGDSLTLLNVYREWNKEPEKQKNKWCFANSLNSKALRIARETVNEVMTLLKKEAKVKVMHDFKDPQGADVKLQKILFDSFTSNICHSLGLAKAGYYAPRLEQQVHAHPSSVLNPLNLVPEWLVFEQSMKTSRDFITGLTPVNESWVVEAIESGRLKRDLEEMRKKQLLPVHVEHVGSYLFWKLVGPYFTKLKQFEEEASNLVKPDLVVIEASKEKGELKIFCSDHTTEKLSQLFNEVTGPVKEFLEGEDLEVPLGQSKERAGVRVILGKGGDVKDIVMADEFRTIFVDRPDESSSADTILNKFGRFGKIKDHRVFKNPQKRWGCITFESSEAAKVAVNATKSDSSEVAIPEKHGRGYQNSRFKVKITWCRRESKGFGFVDVAPEVMPQILRRGSLYIKGILVSIGIDRKSGKSLYLRNLGQTITEADIKKAILSSLDNDDDEMEIFQKVTVVREKVNTTKEQLSTFKTRLQAQLKHYSPDNRFHLEMKEPYPTSVHYLAFASFTNPDEGIAACQGLSRQFYLNDRVVTMEPDIRSSLYVNREVHAAIKDDLDAYLEEFSTFGYSEVGVTSKTLKDGTVVLDINASSSIELAKVRANLQDIVQGDVLECGANPNLRQLFTRAGRDFLKDAEKKCNAFIQVDGRTFTLSIRGKQEATTRVRISINDFLQELSEGEWKEVRLRGRDKPNGLMKTLMNEYGIEFEKLQQDIGLRSVVLNFKQQIVKLVGSAEDIDKAVKVIEDISSKLLVGVKAPEEEELPDCCVCFCPIEPKELYRLQCCGHAYCLDCVKRQVETAVTGRDLPILCGHDGCGQPFAWKDLSNLVREGTLTVAGLALSSLSSFVGKNSKIYKYCLTPNCNMVYRVTSTGAVFHCSECSVRICTSCHTQYHDGMTCAMYQSGRDDEGSLDQWLAANSKTTKKCPNCQTPIEKTMGCNNMHCTGCKCNFCWLCLIAYKSEDECYKHLQKKHGGFV
ncbi:ATP-dependent RNA helicase DEAH12, chloroplastic-like [Haliotis rufescens]|uniref:ATP-dependent RNA helicase DEAH12, chloroplastic-like n=1 Tax=Haliotis rufescens TaxID=6454 RepID=UPI00201F2437|nr:ATP-dependent RNA helicase DEAH12, chloroplastic-like [Haliotis rufescens]XP_048252006.1 ATP-dependent RNA helicase DEAH12, chloroplastic-like [Haliotis rufescens]